MDWNQIVAEALIVIIPAVATALLRIVAPEVFAWIGEHYAWAKQTRALAVLQTITEQFVTEAGTASVNQLKADGRWSPQEGARIKKAVSKQIATALPQWAHSVLSAITDDLGELIGARVEQVVAANQATGIQAKVAAAVSPPSQPPAASVPPASA